MAHAIVLCIALCASSARAERCTTTQQSESAFGLQHTTYVVAENGDCANRFGVERVVIDNAFARHLAAPIILLPPLGNSAREYLVGDEPGGDDFQHSIAANLAKEGLDVYLYSPRETFLAPGQCADQEACAAAAGWGFDAILDDLKFVRALIKHEHPLRKPIIGGDSMGGVVGLAAVNQKPDAYAGLLLGDSPMVIADASMAPGFESRCQGKGDVSTSQFVDASFGPLLLTLAALEGAAPDAATPIPFFPPGTTNRQAYVAFLTTPSVGPPASLFPTGLALLTGDVAQDRFFVASEPRANALISASNYYIPNAIFHDLACAFAGHTDFTSNLAQFKGPILSFEFGKGFGPYDNDVIALTRSRDVDVVVFPDYGHVDLLGSPDHKQLFEDRVVRWAFSDTLFR